MYILYICDVKIYQPVKHRQTNNVGQPIKQLLNSCMGATNQRCKAQRKTAECQKRRTSQEERRKPQLEERQLELC